MTRIRRYDIVALNQRTASTTSPICQFSVRIAHGWPLHVKNEAVCWRKFATSTPITTIVIGPGHHATNPAKNPQNGPSALWVQT